MKEIDIMAYYVITTNGKISTKLSSMTFHVVYITAKFCASMLNRYRCENIVMN